MTLILEYLEKTGIAGNIDAAVILGSGLGSFAKTLEDAVSVSYGNIPGFPPALVPGHEGVLYCGYTGTRKVLAFSGRFHPYEGYPPEVTLLPVRLSGSLGVPLLIVTNAAGGINHTYQIGDLMLIHKLIRVPESTSDNDELSRMETTRQARQIADQNNIVVRSGNYLFTKGPSYETKAEIRAFRTLGADAVGMSTAAELREACSLNIKNIGISLITNRAAGLHPARLSHDEITEAAGLREKDFGKLIQALIAGLT